MNTLLLTLIKTSSLVGAIYFSVALAVQINSGGDVEYWFSLFIGAGILLYSLIDWQQERT